MLLGHNPGLTQARATTLYLPYGDAGGRLTLTASTPVTTSNVTAATTVRYTPYKSDRIGLYDGSANWAFYTFSELSVSVPSTTNTNYDVFVYDNAGTLTLDATAWSGDTTRATNIVYQNGVLVKSGATARRYVGSFRTTGTTGQTEDSTTRRFVYNYYNRVGRVLQASDGTSHSYTTATYRAWNNNSPANVTKTEWLTGVSEDPAIVTMQGTSQASASISVGVNSTTTPGVLESFATDTTSAIRFGVSGTLQPRAGYSFAQAIESGAASAQFFAVIYEIFLLA